MPTHFNAFISYRHHPVDSKIAQTIHRSLERFHIPRAIQKSTGVKKIDRIFRDKEELPLSINLSDDITSALVHSDFLIVICTPRLKESAWCRREIEFFMQLHGRERILIVLGEGEPDDVVPDILMKDQEPLCCDYRMKPRQAKQIELPRLAAAILGCRYDDLVQRQRQYRNRRIAAAVSVAMAGTLALAGYYYKTSREIQANYEQSLRNQSQYLASTSQELLDAGDRLTAIHLATEAVPSAENKRPWVAEAEYALSEAVMAYSSSEQFTGINAYTHSDWVVDYFVSDDGAYLISWDQSCRFYVWDTKTYQLLRTIQTPVDISYYPVVHTGERYVIAADYDMICCYDYLDGTLVWEITDARVQNIVVSPDGNTLAAAGYQSGGLLLIDIQTGSIDYRAKLPANLILEYKYMQPVCFSADGTMLALQYDGESGDQLLLYDLENRQFDLNPVCFYAVQQMCFNSYNELVVSGMLEERDTSGFFSQMGFYYIQENLVDLMCLRMGQQEPVWQQQMCYYLPEHEAFLISCDYPNAGNAISCTYGNVCNIYDGTTGEQLQHLEMRSTAVACEYKSDGILRWYLDDGSFCTNRLGEKDVSSIKYFINDVVDGFTSKGAYIRANGSNQIIFYRYVSDDSWVAFENGEGLRRNAVAAQNDQYLVLYVDYDYTMRCYDIAKHSFVWEKSGENRGEILGITPDGYLVEIKRADNILRLHDLATGETAEKTLEVTPAEGYTNAYRHSSITELAGNNLICLVESIILETVKLEDGSVNVNLSGESKWELSILNLLDGTEKRFEMPQMASLLYSDVRLVADAAGENMLIVWRDKEENVFSGILDAQTGEFRVFDEPGFLPSYGNAIAAWQGNLLAFRDAEGMWLYDHSTGEKKALDAMGSNAISVYFTPAGQLMVLYENLIIRVYDSATGEELHSCEVLSTGYSLSAGTTIQWDIHENILMVNANAVCTLINMDTWEYYCYVRNVLCFDHANDAFCVYVYDYNSLAYYQRYTTDMLIQRAKGLLGSNELSQELREQYGLNN